MRNKVIFIVGPTAVGKTALSIKLAKEIDGEIISADSMQVYKYMPILSQAPTKSQRKIVKHHLIGFLNPKDEYSAALFSRLAKKKIEKIIKRGKTPIVVGGSGLYIKALRVGVFPSNGKDEGLRRTLSALADKKGSLFLHDRLKKIDAAASAKIHPNDLKRIIRALEIYETEKKTKTSLKRKTKGLRDEYDIKVFGIAMDRKELYERINKRVDSMFKIGVAKEVRNLMRRKLSLTAKQALGIKELEGYLKKRYSLAEAKELLKKNTRRFAKRQLTWFRADKDIVWLDNDTLKDEAWKKRYW